MRTRAGFTSVLAATMAASTFMLLVFGVYAEQLIAEFAITRSQVGLLVTASSGIAAVTSPLAGGITDRIGARRMTLLTLVGAALALAAVGLAPTYLLLFVAASATAIPQAMANPGTNKLIALHVPAGSRGVVTGIKQSGVQIGVFVGGISLASIADATDWRVGVLVFAAAWGAFALLAMVSLPHDEDAEAGRPPSPAATTAGGDADDPAERGGRMSLPPLVRRVTVYGFLLGAGGSTLFTYIPLYAEEGLGTSARVAGAVVSLTGLVGIAARIGWGRTSEHRLGALRSLRVIAWIAIAPPVLCLLAPAVGTWLLWPVAVLTGLSASAWNAVGMLAIIQGLPPERTGAASGRVMLGFLAGLGLGAPAFGQSVDLTGDYVVGWLGAAAMFAAAILVLVGQRDEVHERRVATAVRVPPADERAAGD